MFRDRGRTAAEIYLGGGTPAPGARFENKALAGTYSRILAEAEAASGDRDGQIEAARRTWYEGFVAAAIDDFTARARGLDVTGPPHGRPPAGPPPPGLGPAGGGPGPPPPPRLHPVPTPAL